MDAPEKLYLIQHNGLVCYQRNNDEDIEYTRSDVFIERACEWLKDNVTNNHNCTRVISRKGIITMGELISDFKKYMEGE